MNRLTIWAGIFSVKEDSMLQINKTCMIAFMLGFLGARSASATDVEFEAFLKQQQTEFTQFEQQHLKEFESFIEAWKQAEQAYKNQISEKWDTVELPSKKIWVNYSDDLNTRTSINYETGKVKVEFLNQSEKQNKVVEAKAVIKQLTGQTPEQALQKDPVFIQVAKSISTKVKQQSQHRVKAPIFAPKMIAKVVSKPPRIIKKEKVTSVEFTLPKQNCRKKRVFRNSVSA